MSGDKLNAARNLAVESLTLLDYVLTHPQQAQALNQLAAHLRDLPDIGTLLAYVDSEKGQVHLQTMSNNIDALLEDWPAS